jgi:hypothetical protein
MLTGEHDERPCRSAATHSLVAQTLTCRGSLNRLRPVIGASDYPKRGDGAEAAVAAGSFGLVRAATL